MSVEQLDQLAAMLRQFNKEDFGLLPDFILGNWSRLNLDALMSDIEILASRKLAG